MQNVQAWFVLYVFEGNAHAGVFIILYIVLFCLFFNIYSGLALDIMCLICDDMSTT